MKKKTDKAEKAPPTEAPAEQKKKKPSKKKEKFFHARGKRKESVARATISEGKGVVRINSMLVDFVEPMSLRDILLEPVQLAGDSAANLDINVNVYGGGIVGQMQAARVAIAKALIRHTGSEELKKKMIAVDRNMVIEDIRRVEPKKYKGPKARARYQKSYR
jgi:small subunit ribosomal protein S9